MGFVGVVEGQGAGAVGCLDFYGVALFVFWGVVDGGDVLNFYDVGAADYQVFVDSVYWQEGAFFNCDEEAQHCAVGNYKAELAKVEHDGKNQKYVGRRNCYHLQL